MQIRRRPTVPAICAAGVIAATAALAGSALVDASIQDLESMEIRAQGARELFWDGKYREAAEIYRSLTTSLHPSATLYLSELSMCYMALGERDQAKRCLLDVSRLIETYLDPEREKAALSTFGKEAFKVYRGDPYERATAMLLLSFVLADEGDYENARAACKTGQLADSDAVGNTAESDYTMLHLMEGMCCYLLKSEEASRQCMALAEKCFRADTVGGAGSAVSTAATVNVDSARVFPACLSPDAYNVLLLVPDGKAPRKVRQGKDSHLVLIEKDKMSYAETRVQVDEQIHAQTPLCSLADVAYHATTRGGRQMDAILNGKAATRDSTIGTGKVITEVGNGVGGVGGLAIALIGAAVQSVGSQIDAGADVRSWQCLPGTFKVYPLKLAVGQHKASFERYVYTRSAGKTERTFTVTGDNRVAIVMSPPTLAGLYSEDVQGDGLKLGSRDLQVDPPLKPGASLVRVLPPLGFRRLQRITEAGSSKPVEVLAPDYKQVMRTARKVLVARGISSLCVSHLDGVSGLRDPAGTKARALQVRFLDATRQGGSYTCRFELALVNTATGADLCAGEFSATATPGANDDGAVTALYKCVGTAMEQFVAKPEFQAGL